MPIREANSEDEQHEEEEKESKVHASSSNADIESNGVSLVAADSEVDEEEET